MRSAPAPTSPSGRCFSTSAAALYNGRLPSPPCHLLRPPTPLISSRFTGAQPHHLRPSTSPSPLPAAPHRILPCAADASTAPPSFLCASGVMVFVKKIPWHQSLEGLDFHCTAQVEMTLLKFLAQGWDQEVLLPGGHGLMIRGYRPVINTLAKGLDIRLGHRVVEIVRHRNRVEVTVSSDRTFVVDAAVVAVPLGVLKANTIKFEPRLPEWKEEAIRELSLGVENKIVLHFSEVFWPNVEFLGVVSSTTYGCSYFLNLHKATGHPVLVYMPAGRLACDIEKMAAAPQPNLPSHS